MKTVLLIADAYYPLTLAGAHRPAKLAKFLPEFGWVPTVVCPDWTAANSQGFHDPALAADADSSETVRVAHSGYPRTLLGRAFRRFEESVWPYLAPVKRAAAVKVKAQQLVDARHFDAVWSTYTPGYPHVVAANLAVSRGLPWVADFRDLPDQTYRDQRTAGIVAEEKRVCSVARALVAPSRALADRLADRHLSPTHVIPNGFDEDDYPRTGAVRTSDFVIRYFGILYEFRDPRPLFAAIDRLIAADHIAQSRIAIEFYGTEPKQIDDLRRGFQCAERVFALPRVGRQEMFALQQSATVLLNMQSSDAGGAVPSKLMEYLGARRPVLNVPGDGGAIDEVMKSTAMGATAATADAIGNVLREWLDEWRRNGELAWRGSDAERARFTRRSQAGALARILDAVS